MKSLIIYLFLSVMFISCGSDEDMRTTMIKTMPMTSALESDCGSSADVDIYELNEKYFGKDAELTMNLRVVYFLNGVSKPMDEKTLKGRVKISNNYFKNAKIKFDLVEVLYVEGKPQADTAALKNIQAVEVINGKRREDLRSKYYIQHFDFWNTVYQKKGVITAYIFDNVDTGFSGVAGGIGSTFFAIRATSVNPLLHTWEHELGHCMGLYHTHQRDETNGLNSLTGDMVCDTYTSIDTLAFMVDSCKLVKDCDIPNEHIERLIINMMSYTDFECRAEFTPVQNLRKRKMIETTRDLRDCIANLPELKQQLWKNLPEVSEDY